MDLSLTTHKLPQLTHHEVHSLNSPIIYKETELVFKQLNTKTISGPSSFNEEFQLTFKEHLTAISYSSFRKETEDEEELSNPF